MVKKRGIVWNYYNKKVDGSQVIAFCKFCDQSYIQNATRMERHMERCPKCPEDIRQQFIQVAHNKKHKTSALDVKMNDDWPKQETSMDHSLGDTELEDLDEWNCRTQPYTNGAPVAAQQDMELLTQSNQQAWLNRDTLAESNNTDTPAANRNWGMNESNIGSAPPVGSQERTSAVHQRKSYNPRRISQWPVLSMRTPGYSPLQSKIYQEQLLERRALRRVAELELRRKTLELERMQWEYERDKVQTEVRWAHETRMMQLKEDRERQSTEQSKTCTGSRVK